MTTVNTSPDPGPDDKVSLLSNQQGMAALALLSFGAGFLHAAVIKSHEGHGRVATIFTVLAIHHRLAPATINLDDFDPAISLDVVHGEHRKLPEGDIAALNNSFGFGGHNLALTIRSI